MERGRDPASSVNWECPVWPLFPSTSAVLPRDVAANRKLAPTCRWPALIQSVRIEVNSRWTSPKRRWKESGSLKKERIKKKIYRTRELAQAEISDYIDSFYNPTRRHSHLGGVSPEEFETAGRRRRRVH